jgi:hypothetical protein
MQKKKTIAEKSKLFTGMILKVLLMPMEKLGSVVHGVNLNRKSPKGQIKGAPKDNNR